MRQAKKSWKETEKARKRKDSIRRYNSNVRKTEER